MRIMVTGSRDWSDKGAIRSALANVGGDSVTLLHGGARGADKLAAEVGRELGWDVQCFAADWAKHGKAAGVIRNAEMIAMLPDLVLAFPLSTSRGTWDAVRRAKAAGIEVVIYPKKEEK